MNRMTSEHDIVHRPPSEVSSGDQRSTLSQHGDRRPSTEKAFNELKSKFPKFFDHIATLEPADGERFVNQFWKLMQKMSPESAIELMLKERESKGAQNTQQTAR